MEEVTFLDGGRECGCERTGRGAGSIDKDSSGISHRFANELAGVDLSSPIQQVGAPCRLRQQKFPYLEETFSLLITCTGYNISYLALL